MFNGDVAKSFHQLLGYGLTQLLFVRPILRILRMTSVLGSLFYHCHRYFGLKTCRLESGGSSWGISGSSCWSRWPSWWLEEKLQKCSAWKHLDIWNVLMSFIVFFMSCPATQRDDRWTRWCWAWKARCHWHMLGRTLPGPGVLLARRIFGRLGDLALVFFRLWLLCSFECYFRDLLIWMILFRRVSVCLSVRRGFTLSIFAYEFFTPWQGHRAWARNWLLNWGLPSFAFWRFSQLLPARVGHMHTVAQASLQRHDGHG